MEQGPNSAIYGPAYSRARFIFVRTARDYGPERSKGLRQAEPGQGRAGPGPGRAGPGQGRLSCPADLMTGRWHTKTATTKQKIHPHIGPRPPKTGPKSTQHGLRATNNPTAHTELLPRRIIELTEGQPRAGRNEPRILANISGQHIRPKFPAEISGQNVRPKFPARISGQHLRPKIPARISGRP